MKVVIFLFCLGVTLLCLGTGATSSADGQIPSKIPSNTINENVVDCSAPARSTHPAFPDESVALFDEGLFALLGVCAEESPKRALAAFMKAREIYLTPVVPFFIGHMHERGLGTGKDEKAAEDWYRISALEWIAQRDRDLYLAMALEPLGLDGPPPLLAAAMNWAKEVESASPERQLEMSRKMLAGDGQPKDLRGSTAALRWAAYRKNSGTLYELPEALYELGNRHRDRLLPPEFLINFPDADFNSAFFWGVAADLGYPPAMIVTGRVCESRNDQKSRVQAYRWYEQAVNLGANMAKSDIDRLSRELSKADWERIKFEEKYEIDIDDCLPDQSGATR